MKLGLVVNLGERVVNYRIYRVVNGLGAKTNAKTQRRKDAKKKMGNCSASRPKAGG